MYTDVERVSPMLNRFFSSAFVALALAVLGGCASQSAVGPASVSVQGYYQTDVIYHGTDK